MLAALREPLVEERLLHVAARRSIQRRRRDGEDANQGVARVCSERPHHVTHVGGEDVQQLGRRLPAGYDVEQPVRGARRPLGRGQEASLCDGEEIGLSVDDLGVRMGYAAAWGLDPPPTPKELTLLGEPFRPYRSVVARYCWEAVALLRGGTDPSLR